MAEWPENKMNETDWLGGGSDEVHGRGGERERGWPGERVFQVEEDPRKQMVEC